MSWPFAHLFPSLQVPDMLQQRAGGRLPEPLLRVRAGPGVAVLLLSLQQEMSLLLLVSLAAERKPGDSWGCRGAWEGAVRSLFLTADKPGPSRRVWKAAGSSGRKRKRSIHERLEHFRWEGPPGSSASASTPLFWQERTLQTHRTKRSLVQSYAAFHGGHPAAGMC